MGHHVFVSRSSSLKGFCVRCVLDPIPFGVLVKARERYSRRKGLCLRKERNDWACAQEPHISYNRPRRSERMKTLLLARFIDCWRYRSGKA